MRKAVVTGANGFIGSWLVRELSANGTEVYAVVRGPKSDLSRLENISGSAPVHTVFCELCELKDLSGRIEARGFDEFYHLAWEGSTGPARGDYALQLQNAKYTVDAVDAASALGCRRFVGSGTLAELDCYAYGIEDGSKPAPVSCYGSAKIAAHFMSKAESARLNVEHVWTYLSNTYGVGNRTQNFVNFAAKTMLSGKRAAFTSGEQPYDFVYVSDTVKALRLAGEKGKPFHDYYLGSTKPRKLKEFITAIRDSIDPSIPLYLGEIPFLGKAQPASVFDCGKLVRDTGYTPQVPFEEGIKTTVEWLKSKGNE